MTKQLLIALAITLPPAAGMAAGGSAAAVSGIAALPAPRIVASDSSLATSTFDVSGIASWNAAGDAANVVIIIPVGANVRIDSISWNVSIEAYNPSWLADFGIQFTSSAGSPGGGFWLRPAAGVQLPGIGSYASAPLNLEAAGLAFNTGSDGLLRLEFFESYDDDPDVQDGLWLSGTVTVGYVPEPATWGLMALGLTAFGAGLHLRRGKKHR